MRAVAIEQGVLSHLESAVLDTVWFSDFGWPTGQAGVRRVVKDDIAYLLSDAASERSRFVVISSAVFADAASPQHVLDRAIRVALSVFDRTVAIPVSWRAYNEGARYSIYAQPEGVARSQRLHFDRAPEGTGHLFVYALTDVTEAFSDVPYDGRLIKQALGAIDDAILEEQPQPSRDGAFGIVLGPALGAEYVGAATLEQWVTQKLTQQQRDFVSRGYVNRLG